MFRVKTAYEYVKFDLIDIINRRVIFIVDEEVKFNEYVRLDEYNNVIKLKNILETYKNINVKAFYINRDKNNMYIIY